MKELKTPTLTEPAPNAIFLGTAPATRSNYKRAFTVGILLVIAFLLTAPWADHFLIAIPSFVPIYNMAVFVLDLVTAVLLFAQFQQLRERSFLLLFCAYLFAPLLIAAHALSFPDAFVQGNLIGGAQTTAWLWVGWHTLFPVFIIWYAILRQQETKGQVKIVPKGSPVTAVAISATIALAAGIVLFTTVGEKLLPELMIGNSYRSSFTKLILSVGWLVHIVALSLLILFTRLKRLIDVWLALALVAFVIDLALSALLINARYQIGFYLGRVYGLFASSFILMLLLKEAIILYGNAIKTAEALLKQKDEFIGIASHELKTPVTSIKAYAQVLQSIFKARGNNQGEMFMQKLDAQVNRLTNLIRDLLDTTKISEGQLSLNPEQFDINHLIAENIADLQHISYQHRLVFTPGEDIPLIKADRERIGQVLTNLLSNAIKYSPDGGDIHIASLSREGNMEVSIKDPGVGIPPDMKHKIFDRFFRVSDSKIRTFPGMGLGLYITAGIIHRHGGTISVESIPGEGSVFSFILPVQE